MQLGLESLTVAVVGGSSGIGFACAQRFAREGATVALMSQDESRAHQAAESLSGSGGTVQPFRVDIRNEASVREALASVASACAGIDILVCSAGVSGLLGRDFSEVSVEEWDSLMDVNLRGQWLLVKHARRYLKCSSNAAVVMLSSDSAFVVSPNHVPYCASKGGVVSLARALSLDLWNEHIRVNCVCPSIVDTPLSRVSQNVGEGGFNDSDYPVHKAEDIAACVAFLASPLAISVNGQTLVADFGYSVRSNFPG